MRPCWVNPENRPLLRRDNSQVCHLRQSHEGEEGSSLRIRREERRLRLKTGFCLVNDYGYAKDLEFVQVPHVRLP